MRAPDWLMAALAAVWPGLAGDGGTHFNGYLEGDFLYPSAAAPGRIAAVEVSEGQKVAQGQELFRLEAAHQEAALKAARARVEVARANLADLATGSREAEIEVIRATLQRAQADLDLARSNLARSERLLAGGSVSEVRVETDRTALAGARARVSELAAQLQVAELPARDARRIAAEATLEAAEAEAELARRDLEDRVVKAPAAGRIDKLYYDAGEVVATGAPVMRVLPPGTLVAVFFVPEGARAALSPGDRLELVCSHCPAGLTATLTQLAEEPQFTPPILYSEDERSRLVFRAEARVEDAAALLPGQPVTLRLLE